MLNRFFMTNGFVQLLLVKMQAQRQCFIFWLTYKSKGKPSLFFLNRVQNVCLFIGVNFRGREGAGCKL